jgi:3-phenylpropionate/cinnamic acid dioxygenase small subunit
MPDDRQAIQKLLMTYAEHVDAGRFAEAAALFEHATYRVERPDGSQLSACEGASEVEAFMGGTRLYPDGTPRTKHAVTNVDIDLDGASAHSRCYATVFQQTDAFPLQPIASGCYVDRFERVDGEWRFADRVISGFLLGDRSHHVVWHAEGSAS